MGASLDFDATDVISLGAINPLSGASAITCSMWIRWDDVSNNGQYFFGRDFATSVSIGFNGPFLFRLAGTGGSFIRAADAAIATLFSDDIWYHIAWTWDYNGGSQLSDLYINGVVEATSYYALSDTVSALAAGTGNFNIGDTNLSSTYDFAGKISNVKIHDRALTAGEIQELVYKPASISKNCKGNWPLYNTDAKDLSGEGNDGTNTGAAEDSSGPPVYFPKGLKDG